MMTLRTPTAFAFTLLVALGAWAADQPCEEVSADESPTVQQEVQGKPAEPSPTPHANWGSNGGMGPKYSGYLLEGLPTDAFVDGMSLDPAAFQRVEVQRGPAAVMYSNYLAMDFAGNQTPLAGITNYVLRNRVDVPLTRIQAGFGSWATTNAQAYHQGRTGNLHYFVGGNWERSNYTNCGTPGSWLGILDDPQYTKVKLYGKGTVFLGPDQSLLLRTNSGGDVAAALEPRAAAAIGTLVPDVAGELPPRQP